MRSDKYVKRSIRLTDEQCAPFPIETESMWFYRDDKNYRLKDIPLFVDCLSFDDLVSLTVIDPDKNLFEVEKLVDPSPNSTIWIFLKDGNSDQEILAKIGDLGCGIYGGMIENMFAINIPGSLDLEIVLKLLVLALDAVKILVDYPSIRHAGHF